MKNRVVKTQYRECPNCFNHQGKYLNTVNEIKLLRCNQCQMVFADVDNATVEETCRYKPGTILHYYQNEPIQTIAYYDNVIEHLTKILGRTNLKILEFGCGSGMFLRRARKKGFITQGIDFSEYSEYASKAFDLNILSQSIFDCHLPSNHFDVVYSHATFEHLYSPRLIAEELIRILKPTGIFIISGVPNYNTISIKLLRNFYNNNPPGHINYYEVETIRTMYQVLGLEKIKVSTYGINFWFFFYWLQRKKIQPNMVQFNTFSETEIMDKLKHETTDLDNLSTTLLQRIVANLYCQARLPKMGVAISAWGYKPQ
jgi:SAM-dependent methyltransferase